MIVWICDWLRNGIMQQHVYEEELFNTITTVSRHSICKSVPFPPSIG